MNNKLYKQHQWWILGLTTMWLISTFEHNYFTLSKYTHPVEIMNFSISGISVFLMVLALDLSIFWSVMFIPQAKISDIPIKATQWILTIATIISILLNVRYMYTASLLFDDPNWFDYAIGIFVGTLVPIFVVIFGWIEGNVAVKQMETFKSNISITNGDSISLEDVERILIKNPGASGYEIARILQAPASTVYKRIQQIKEREVKVEKF